MSDLNVREARWTERSALVTGAGGGLGRAIALRLVRDGWSLVLLDANNAANQETLSLVEESGGAGATFTADVSDAGAFGVALSQAERVAPPIEILVNNAGIEGTVAPVWSYGLEVFDAVWNVNVRGALVAMQGVLPGMIRRGRGAVVNIASTSAIRGRKGLSGYVASKHAVLGLTRTAALDVAPHGLRVNAVLPGPVRGAMIERIDAMAGGVERAGEARLAEPDDIAAMVAFLSSDDARHINGAAMVVDGASTVL
ncbi:MAG: hypothetical protein VR78_15520 [Hoeflea sp. BRH_c9]|nr:MAG: hypothetical protein VR78_15520 [Hoeflea sp. BRH_c9]